MEPKVINEDEVGLCVGGSSANFAIVPTLFDHKDFGVNDYVITDILRDLEVLRERGFTIIATTSDYILLQHNNILASRLSSS